MIAAIALIVSLLTMPAASTHHATHVGPTSTMTTYTINPPACG